MSKVLEQVEIKETFTDQDLLLGVLGNKTTRIPIADVKKGLIKNNDMYLNQVAFFIDVNEPADTPLNVNVGGNRQMFELWKTKW